MTPTPKIYDLLRTLGRFFQGGLALLAPLALIILWEALVRGDFRIGSTVLFHFKPV